MKRFSFLGLSLLAGLAHAGSLTIVNFGGANGDAQKTSYYQPFERATGTKVYAVEYNGELGKLKAMVEARNVTWDVLSVEQSAIGRACEEGLLEKLDAEKTVRKSDFLDGAVHDCGIGQIVWSDVMAYNGDKLNSGPRNWADFWDVKKFPGKRGMHKSARETLEYALMADEVAPKDVYSVLATPAGVDRAFKKLDQIKKYIVWWEAGAQPQQLLLSGEVVMSTAYAGRIDAAQREGKNLKIVWNGAIYGMDYWTIPKGSPNKAIAQNFIAFASKPQQQRDFVRRISYGPTNLETLKTLDEETLSRLPNSSEHLKHAVMSNSQFWSDYGVDLDQRFAAWAAK